MDVIRDYIKIRNYIYRTLIIILFHSYTIFIAFRY